MSFKRKIILIILAILIVIMFGLYFYYSKDSSISNNNSNSRNHKDEFEIVESNYLERNYQRYVDYKNKKSNISDDRVITEVNIGLDKKFYEDTEKTNLLDGILKIVNKHYYLDKEFKPDLVDYNSKDIKVEVETARNLEQMFQGAKENNVELKLEYAYIDYDFQEDLYEMYVNGGKNGENHYAKPGYSEYQTGQSVCLGFASVEFANTVEYAWLTDNSYKYGFILRYPEGKESITGFDFEPWHYRYVGKDVAKIIHDKNITFEEYYATYVLK